MDDDWGYPYFRKPPSILTSGVFSWNTHRNLFGRAQRRQNRDLAHRHVVRLLDTFEHETWQFRPGVLEGCLNSFGVTVRS